MYLRDKSKLTISLYLREIELILSIIIVFYKLLSDSNFIIVMEYEFKIFCNYDNERLRYIVIYS